MRKYAYLLSIFIFFIACLPRIALAQDPVSMLDSVANQMISSLKAHKATLKTNPAVVFSIAYKIVVPHADLDVMARNVLPPRTWAAASEQQRKAFEKEFTTLLVRTYASALAQYSDETVQFFPVRGGYEGKSGVDVNSTIVRNDGPNISVNYRVVHVGSQWKLYDMSVEGISMLESFRSQFADKLSQGNMTDLISALKEHNVRNARTI